MSATARARGLSDAESPVRRADVAQVVPLPSGPDKAERRRIALAESALKTLGELGYANTSLRDIAANSEFSHGVLHYYFRDKTDLITYCVRHYKTTCARRYDGALEVSRTADELAQAVRDTMVQTLVDETAMHRLWYDLRAQSMFEPALRADVVAIDALLEDMIRRIVTRYAELSGLSPAVDDPTAYAVIDGVFEQAVTAFGDGPEAAAERLRERMAAALPLLFVPAGSAG